MLDTTARFPVNIRESGSQEALEASSHPRTWPIQKCCRADDTRSNHSRGESADTSNRDKRIRARYPLGLDVLPEAVLLSAN